MVKKQNPSKKWCMTCGEMATVVEQPAPSHLIAVMYAMFDFERPPIHYKAQVDADGFPVFCTGPFMETPPPEITEQQWDAIMADGEQHEIVTPDGD